MSAWRGNEREVALTRHARQAEKRTSTLPPPLEVVTLCFPNAPNWISLPPSFCFAHCVCVSRIFFVTDIWGGCVPLLCDVEFRIIY